MKKLKIELDILIFILIEAFFLLFFLKESLTNLLIGSLLGIIIVFLTKKIKNNKIEEIVLLIISFFLLFSVFKKVTSFISFNILRNYPTFIIILTFVFLTVFLAKRGFHTYIKALELSTYFYLFIKLFSFILIIPNINFHHFNYQLLDELNINYHLIYIASFIFYISLSIKYLTNKEMQIKRYIISSINPLFIKTFVILTLGRTLFYLYDYPYVNIFKRIKYFDFIERMEGILSFQYLSSFFFLTTFIIIVIVTLTKKVLKKD